MPSALEFAVEQGRRRDAANALRTQAIARMLDRRQEQKQLVDQGELRKELEAMQQAGALQRTALHGALQFEAEKAQTEGYMKRVEAQQKAMEQRAEKASERAQRAARFKTFVLNNVIQREGEKDEDYIERGNRALAEKAEFIFGNVDDIRRQANELAIQEGQARTKKILEGALSVLPERERASVRKNPANLATILADPRNASLAAAYEAEVQRLDKNLPPLSVRGDIALQGLTAEANRWEALGANVLKMDDMTAAVEYMRPRRPKAAQQDFTLPRGADPVVAPPTVMNFGPAPSMNPVLAAPEQDFLLPKRNIFSPTPEDQALAERMRLGVPAPSVYGMPFSTGAPF